MIEPRSAKREHSRSDARQLAQCVVQARFSHFMQDPLWGFSFGDGEEQWRCVVSGEGIGGARAGSLLRVVGRAAGFRKGFVDGGPVFSHPDELAQQLSLLRATAADCMWVRVRPYAGRDECPEVVEILQDHGYRLVPPESCSWYATTTVIDLEHSMQHVYARFSPGLRRNLRKGERLGLRAEQADGREAYAQFANLLLQSAHAAGYPVPQPAALVDYLCRVSDRGMALFVLRRRGVIVAGIVVLPAGAAAVYQWGARDRACDEALPLTHLLHWTAIQWARDRGFRYYDFGGLNVLSAQNGIDRFKQSFGGRPRAFAGEAVLALRPLVAHASSVASALARRLRVSGAKR